MSKRNKLLKLLHNPESSGLMPILELLDSSPPQRKFVGLKMKKVLLDGQERFEFERKSEGDVVKYHHLYKKAVKEGVLLPADAETARLCGVEWDQPKKTQITKRRSKPEESYKTFEE